MHLQEVVQGTMPVDADGRGDVRVPKDHLQVGYAALVVGGERVAEGMRVEFLNAGPPAQT